jgi:hypothetical protein
MNGKSWEKQESIHFEERKSIRNHERFSGTAENYSELKAKEKQ